MKNIKVGDLFITADEIFKVTSILNDVRTRVYTCDTWIAGEGFVWNSDFDMFTDRDIEDYGFEVYSLK
jgi:hypothetical protein